MSDHGHAGFGDRIRLAEARERLEATVDPHGRTTAVSLGDADGRVIAESVTADSPVPHYERAAMDGFAVRAEDSFGAGERSPVVLEQAPDTVGPRQAVRVHTGSAIPPGADAVVMVEHTEVVGDDVEVFDAVPEGENVAPVGEDVRAGQSLFDPGHRLRPSDIGLLKSTGITEIEVGERPNVSVIPTGDELVQSDPAPGEIIETNGMTVTQLVRRWGGAPSYREVVPDETDALEAALETDADHDLLVTTGGSSVGERDLLPEVVREAGEIHFHGVALKPGHPVAAGQVGDTPVIMLPGYPVSTIVNAVQFVRPAIQWLSDTPPSPLPQREARLSEKIRSEPGMRTFARVQVEQRSGERVAIPTRTSGAGVLSSVALADGWVVVPEPREGIPADEMVTVEDWEWLA